MNKKLRYRRRLEAQKRGWWRTKFLVRLRETEGFKRLVKNLAGDWSIMPKTTGRTLSLRRFNEEV